MSDQTTLQSTTRLGTNLTSPSSRHGFVKAFVFQFIVVNLASLIFLIIIGLFEGSAFLFREAFNYNFLISITSLLVITWAIVWVISYIKPSFKRNFIPAALNREPEIASDSISEFITLKAGLAPKLQREADKLITMAAIDERVARLQGRTNIILGVIALALSSAVLVVLFAAQLTSIDVAATSNTDKLKTERGGAKQLLSKLYKYRSLYKNLDDNNKITPRTSGADRDKDQINKELASLYDYRDTFTAPVDSESSIDDIRDQETAVKQLDTLYQAAWDMDIKADKSVSEWRYLVATAITRIGVILIIVFLVQILLGIYRYNTRMSSYYHSIRDILTLWDGKADELKDLHQLLRVPNIDFGKEPKHPLEEIIKAVARHAGGSSSEITESDGAAKGEKSK